MRRRIVEYGITDLIGFRKISNDESEILFWDYRKIHGFACGHLMILVYLNSIKKKAFHGNSCSHRFNGLHMRWTLSTSWKRYNIIIWFKGFCASRGSRWLLPLDKVDKKWSANNKAMTATTFFDYPLETYSLPSIVRTDEKGEST